MALPTKPVVQGSHLQQHALREFGDGLTILGNDVSLPSGAASSLDNFYVAQDKSLQLRFGTKTFIDFNGLSLTVHLSVVKIVVTGPRAGLGWLAGDTVTVNCFLSSSFTSSTATALLGKTVVMPAYTSGSLTGVDVTGAHVVSTVSVGTAIFQYTVTATAPSAVFFDSGTITPALDVTTVETLSGAQIVNIASLQSSIVAVFTNGYVARVDSGGVGYLIWSPLIAQSQGNASPWTTCSFCSFAVFNGILLICDGVNKPLRVDLASTYVCDYIKDPVSNSNTAVPTCRYVTVIDNFVFMAGDAQFVDRVYSSSSGTYSVWRTDTYAAPEPNYANYFDLGKYVVATDSFIKGIGRFRDKLLVVFIDAVLLGDNIGNIVDTNPDPLTTTMRHVPTFSDSIPGTGTISHRSMVAFGNDFYMADNIGVPSVTRALFTGTLIPQRVSQKIDYELQSAISSLSIGTQENYLFAVQNKQLQQYLLFVPTDNTATSYVVYVYTLNESASIKAWSRYTGWNFVCGCNDQTGRMYFGHGTVVYQYGSIADQYYADFIVTSGGVVTSSTPISYTYESAWMDFGSRMLAKSMRYVTVDAYGTAQYTLDVFTDHVYYDSGGLPTPQASMQFSGGDFQYYGNLDQPFGGGRNAFDPALFSFNAYGKALKVRIHGTSGDVNTSGNNLRLIAFNFAYLRGSIR